MHIEKLSLYIVAMNEEKRLPMVLEAVHDLVDEIVIVDSGSTDRTEETARRYGARFIFHEWESIGHQVSWAEEQCSNRWVLRLDADEVLSEGLRSEIREVRERGSDDAYYIKIGEMYPGYKKPHPLAHHYNLIRLYNRDSYRMSGRWGFDDVIKLREGATAGQLRNFVHHYSYLSIHDMVTKRNIETDMQIERALAEGKNYSPWRMVGAMSLNFIKFYFLDRNFLYGFWGFIHSISIAHMRFMKFSKFYEHKELEKHGYMGSKD